MNWNGRQLPVVAFEGMIGGDIPMMTARTRIVVFYASSGNLRGGFFGILTQGFPQLVRVNREVLKLDKSVELPENSPVFCRVKMINEYPLIPDLEEIEERLSEIELQG